MGSGLFILVAVVALFGGVFINAIRKEGDSTWLLNVVMDSFSSLKESYRATLQYFPYYKALDGEHKKRFEGRLKRFILHKQFIPRSIPEVTDEMKAMIGASATQLTFGLPEISLAHFKRILIYPDDYYSRLSRTYHKGEVNPRYGIIVLSWRHFLKGYSNPTDASNLGLHEMAHALRIENVIRNEEYDFLNPRLLAHWDDLAQESMARIHAGEPHLFRDYAGVDEEEFFAVAIENFFERPQKFKEEELELYLTLSLLLNQDPLKKQNPTA